MCRFPAGPGPMLGMVALLAACDPQPFETVDHLSAANGDCDDGRAPRAWWIDADGDGFGDGASVLACDAPAQGVSRDGDCDDANPNLNPDAAEGCTNGNLGATEVVADGIDQDGTLTDACYVDNDGDGQGSQRTTPGDDLDCLDAYESTVDTDCDDGDASVYLGATELVGNGADDDCDGEELCYVDADQDAWGIATTVIENLADVDLTCEHPEGEATKVFDCDDTDKNDFPGARETVSNGDDEDCDGTELCFQDADEDGQGSNVTVTASNESGLACDAARGESSVNTDCDDADPDVYAGAREIIDDGNDEDCDGAELCYVDKDQDGQGDPSGLTVVESADAVFTCDKASFEATNTTDCDDTDNGDYLGATERVGNGDDEDCDGAELCYVDGDRDTFGASTLAIVRESNDAGLACETADGEANDTIDCDDTNARRYVGATEIVANADDEDCDGKERCYVDKDQDSFGASSGATVFESADAGLACDQVNGEANDRTDCDDADDGVHPGAVEIVANDDDEDCDTNEQCYRNLDNDPYGTLTLVNSDDLDCDDSGEAYLTLDCDDADPRRYPGLELCDGRQNDCAEAWVDTQEDGEVTYFPQSGTSFLEATEAWNAGAFGAPASITLPATGTVEICRGTYYASVSTASIPGTLTVNGRYGSAATVLSGGDDARVLRVTGATANVTATGLTLAEGLAAGGGAVWLQSGALRLTSSVVCDSESTANGGGIQADVLVRLDDVAVYDNVAGADGGGLAGEVYCTQCDVHDNDATDAGGGVWATDLTLNNSLVWANTAHDGGGVAFAPHAPVIGSITSTSIDNNLATHGGGVWASGVASSLSFSFSDLGENDATEGGGLYLSGIDGLISGSSVYRNDAERGGGLYQTQGSEFACSGTRANRSGMQQNGASTGGGAVWRDTTSGPTQSNTCDWGVSRGSDDNTTNDVWDSATTTAYNYGDNATFHLP